jgi:RNA polymerase sigma factor (sigma-70 family)
LKGKILNEGGTDKQHIEQADNSTAELLFIDSDHVRDLFDLHWQDLCNYLRSKYDEGTFEIEDVAQAAFTKLAAVEDPGEIRNPKAFLFATARNIAIDEFRKAKIRLAHKQEVLQSPHEEIFDDFSPENVLLERQRLELMNAAIQKLPKIQRMVLLLHRLDKLSYSQIASKFGLSETTVRRHVANAIEKVHKSMKQADNNRR